MTDEENEVFYPDITASNADAVAYILETRGVPGIEAGALAAYLRRAARTIRHLQLEMDRAATRLAYLEGTASLVWRWRDEAEASESTLDGGLVAHVMRSCADELAHSLPARIVAEGGRDRQSP
jgi:hypothetical protein